MNICFFLIYDPQINLFMTDFPWVTNQHPNKDVEIYY